MRFMVLGGCGAWPEPGKACSGFLVEHDGFRLVVDLGYATVPRLLEQVAASQIMRFSSVTGILTIALT